MANWDQIVTDYEAKIKKLETDYDTFVDKANRAVLIGSAIAFVVGLIIGLIL